MSNKQQWIWEWAGGGYNTVMASSKEEALKLAKEKGAPSGTFKGLTVREETLHVAKPGEVEKWARWARSMCD